MAANHEKTSLFVNTLTKKEQEIWAKPLGQLTDAEWKIFLKLVERLDRYNEKQAKERGEGECVTQ